MNESKGALEWLRSFGPWIAGTIATLGAWLFQRSVKSARDEGAASVELQRIEDRDEGFREDILGLRDELKAAVAEFRTGAALTAELRSSQSIINQVTAQAIQSITTRVDQHTEKLSELHATSQLLTEMVALLRKQMERG